MVSKTFNNDDMRAFAGIYMGWAKILCGMYNYVIGVICNKIAYKYNA